MMGRTISSTVTMEPAGVLDRPSMASPRVSSSTRQERITKPSRTASGQAQATYIFGKDRLAGYLPGQSGSIFYLLDALGSVGEVTNGIGADLGSYIYDVFGQTTTATVTVSNSFQFAGQSTEPLTDLQYMRARVYDPITGRFLQNDPTGLRAGINQYVYVENNPTNYVDRLGTVRERSDQQDSPFDQAIDLGADLLSPGTTARRIISLATGQPLPPQYGGVGRVADSTTVIPALGPFYRWSRMPSRTTISLCLNLSRHTLTWQIHWFNWLI